MFLPNLDAAFARPIHTSNGSFWHGHVPFAHFLVARIRPRLIVEFGVEHGDSLFAFADALQWNKVAEARVVGCDSWSGDIHVGDQQNWIFERVRQLAGAHQTPIDLRRMTTLECAPTFEDESVDLLHIDASHDYDSVRADYESMLPKLADGGIVLFHDVAAFAPDFGAWRLWGELSRQHPHLCFTHSAGLGVLAPKGAPLGMRDLLEMELQHKITLARLFAKLGRLVALEFTPQSQHHELARVSTIPVPPELQSDGSLLSACLAASRW